MAEGRSNGAIAEELVVTERAVEKHVTSIFGKLGLTTSSQDHRRVLAVLTYLRSSSRRRLWPRTSSSGGLFIAPISAPTTATTTNSEIPKRISVATLSSAVASATTPSPTKTIRKIAPEIRIVREGRRRSSMPSGCRAANRQGPAAGEQAAGRARSERGRVAEQHEASPQQ